ncbi:hypothetical protein G3580_17365 [Nitrogeniibacter mangrovi]|uniref:Uncharacterized protein n=2 Tax=Nitrogeniibacter mangrovi TaxID=2016596 RepID=A0A6C1B6A7_9RHOO|nr:hypothetical protein G3580_17365 [Nitrogeniibacter mangrovi]
MSLNDPFGRQAAKQARDYAAVAQALREAGVDSLDAAERCLVNIRRNAIVMVWLVMLSIVLAAVIHPPALPIVLVCSVAVLLWVGVSTHRGRTHLLRYMADELGAETSRAAVRPDASKDAGAGD